MAKLGASRLAGLEDFAGRWPCSGLVPLLALQAMTCTQRLQNVARDTLELVVGANALRSKEWSNSVPGGTMIADLQLEG